MSGLRGSLSPTPQGHEVLFVSMPKERSLKEGPKGKPKELQIQQNEMAGEYGIV